MSGIFCFRVVPGMSADLISSPRPRRTCTIILLVVMTICFAGQQIIVVQHEKPYDAYLALSGYGMKSAHLWQLFTYQFFHAGWGHFILNQIMLWFVCGRGEVRWGWRRLLGAYLGTLIIGGLLQGGVAMAGFLLPESMETTAAFIRDRLGGPVYGASAGWCGLLAAWLSCGNGGPSLLLGGWSRQATWFALLVAGCSAAGCTFMPQPSLAHLAHCGACFAGIHLGRRWRQTAGVTPADAGVA